MKSRDDLTERDAFRNHGLVNEEDDNTDGESESASESEHFNDEYEEYLKPPPVEINTDNTIIIKTPSVLQEISKTPNLLYTQKEIEKNGNIHLYHPYSVLQLSGEKNSENFHEEDEILENVACISEVSNTRKKKNNGKRPPMNYEKESVGNENIANFDEELKYMNKKKGKKVKNSPGHSQIKVVDKNAASFTEKPHASVAGFETYNNNAHEKRAPIKVENFEQAPGMEKTRVVEFNSPDYDRLWPSFKKIITPENYERLLQQKENIEETRNGDFDSNKTNNRINPVNNKNTADVSKTNLKMLFGKVINSELFIGIAYVLVHWYIHSKLKKYY